jgi:hypothetical protein
MIKRKAILLGSSLLIAGLSLANTNTLFETTDLQNRISELNKVDDSDTLILNADHKEITETINTHLSGIKEGKIELIESAWLKSSARVTEINQGHVISKDIDQSFALWAKAPTNNLNEKIISIQLTSENVAVAQISLLWNGNTYEDTLTLIKTEKGWKIIGKIYNAPEFSSKLIGGGGYGG